MSAMSIGAGILRLPQTTIGKKVIMALAGLVWIGYLVGHMYGNLKIFTGEEHFNEYAAGLRTLGAPVFGYAHLLWIARIGLIVAFLAHIWAAITLSMRNRETRGSSYVKYKNLRTSSASLTMFYGGIAILLFVIYHLMHFTFGIPGVHPDFVAHNAYHNVVTGFQQTLFFIPVPAIIYLIALAFISLHLYHGAWSMFQTLGLNNKSYSQLWRLLAIGLAIIIPAGFAVVPLAIMFGLVS